MAKGITIEVQGVGPLLKRLRKFASGAVQEVDAEMASISNEYVNRAARSAPVDTGFLRSKITFYHAGQFSYVVVSQAPYSAYIEWGTITQVRVPSDLVEFAAQFKGKGIRKTGGIRPKPFFFIHRLWAKEELNKNLSAVAKRMLSK